MSKFKEGDKIVRVINGTSWAPLGFTCNYMDGINGFGFYFDAHGRKTFIDEDNWGLAEDISKPVTEEYEGNVYQIGKPYLFSMSGVTWYYDNLIDIDGGYSKPFCTKSKEWLYIKEVPTSENMGTITPAPIDLIDGNAYMFDYKGASYIGIYASPPHRFIQVDGFTLSSYCTNIRPMTVAESK
jgi:hypothetical protein